MADETHDVRSLLQVLEMILTPLEKPQRDQILAWVDNEMHTHAIVEYCEDENVPAYTATTTKPDGSAEQYDSGGPLVWRLGQANPLDTTAIVFAMFHWDQANIVAAFSYKEGEVDGKPATAFYRSLICKPVHIHGPVDHFALVTEIGEFIGSDDDPMPSAGEAPAHANGGATA